MNNGSVCSGRLKPLGLTVHVVEIGATPFIGTTMVGLISCTIVDGGDIYGITRGVNAKGVIAKGIVVIRDDSVGFCSIVLSQQNEK